MSEPKVRSVERFPPPYALNDFPEVMAKAVGKELFYSLVTRDSDAFEGPDWERVFAKAIGAEWKPSNVGLDDVALKNCCWSAKTVKQKKPFSIEKIRLIIGRNSLDYSYEVDAVRAMEPKDVGSLVLGIWNERVSSIRGRFHHARTVVLMKGPGLMSNAIFEYETKYFDPETVKWKWNKNRNLEGEVAGIHTFTWQPHGGQFTNLVEVPKNRVMFRLVPPPEELVVAVRKSVEDVVEKYMIGREWVVVV